MYGYIQRYVPLNKEEILKRVTEKEIFSYIFNMEIDYNLYYTAPYRKDNRAGCFFHQYLGKWYFVDFAEVKSHRDCFSLFEITFKLSYFETLERINSIFQLGLNYSKNDLKEVKYTYNSTSNVSNSDKSKILCYLRDFNENDNQYWSSYGITKEQLVSDKVYPIIAFRILKNQKIYLINNLKQSYVFSNFEDNRLKIYSPFSKYKWITSCNQRDIGEISVLPSFGDTLIITKSYKDCRVLRNFGYNSIWIQNERVIPSDDILIDISKRFKNIYIFFDNDSTGLSHIKVMIDKMREYTSNIYPLIIPPVLYKEGIKDISDYYKNKGKELTQQFLTSKIL